MPTFASATSVLICGGRCFQDRVRIEAEVLAEEGRHAPEHVPAMLDYDGRMFTIAMAYIGPPVSRSLQHVTCWPSGSNEWAWISVQLLSR